MRKHICAIAVPLLLSGLLHAQVEEQLREAATRPALTLEQLEELALTNSPALKQAAQSVARAAGQARQSGMFPNPVIGYEGMEIRGGSFGGGEQGGFIEQTFPLGGKRGFRRRVFEEQRKSAEIGVTEQRYRVLSDVGEAYSMVLADGELIKVRHDLLNVALDAVETARQLANVGQADTPDVLQSEVEAEQAKADLYTAEVAFIQDFRVVAALAGRPQLPLAFVEGDLAKPPAIDENRLLETVLRDSPEVKRASQDVARAEAALTSAKKEPIPDLQIRAGLDQSGELLNDSSRKAVGVQGFVTAGITIPLFDRNQGSVAAAAADLERSRFEVTRLQLELQRAVEPLLQDYLAENARAVQYREEMIPRAGRAYELYLENYRRMAAAYPQVLVSQRTLFQLRAAYIQSLERAWSAAIRLRNYTLGGAPAVEGVR